VNEADHLGQTPLHVAAQAGRVGVARFLLVNGADQNTRTTAGQDAEMVATPGVVKVLRERPACSNSDIESQLLEAAKNGEIEVVKVEYVATFLFHSISAPSPTFVLSHTICTLFLPLPLFPVLSRDCVL
jgi:ankyrin repeat protein